MIWFGKEVSVLEKERSILGESWYSARRSTFQAATSGQRGSVLATFLTSLALFAIYLVQGIIVARMLDPAGRGEFGTSLYFPRDILLYAGLLGGVEIVAGYAARGSQQLGQLRYAALRLGLVTGFLTTAVAAIISIVVLTAIGKAYIIPFCLLVCLFVPFEHIHLTVSAVDRGNQQIARYNINRLIFFLAFPLLAFVAWQTHLAETLGISQLLLVCILFVISKIIGVLPTLRGWNLSSYLKHRQADGDLNCNWTTKQMLRDGRPYAISMLVSEAFDRLDIFLILALADVATSGHYFVAVPAAALLIVAPTSFGIFTFNLGASRKYIPSLRHAIAALTATAAFQMLSTAIMLLAMPILIVAFYGESYRPAIPFAMWLLPACAIKGFVHAIDAYLKGRGKPGIGVGIRAVSIFVMLTVAAIFYPSLGIIAIPISAVAGQTFSMLLIVIALVLDVRGRNRMGQFEENLGIK